MLRRFYLRVGSAEPSVSRKSSFPWWFVPGMVVLGTLLGLTAYRLSCRDERMQAQIPLQTLGTGDHAHAPTKTRTGAAEKQSVSSSSVDAARTFEGIRVQILNGCGVKGLAKIITPSLRARGFDVRETKNASNFDHKQSSLIDRTGDIARARMVADSLGIDERNVSSQILANLVDIDLTLIVGADYRRLNLQLKGTTQE